HLKLSDGTLFRAGNGPDSSFSVAPPEAFGFLGTTRAAITIKDGTTLVTQPTQAISLVGGDILIDNAGAVSDGGDIRVAAMGLNTRDVPLSGSPPQGTGNLTLLDGGWLEASTSTSGRSGSIRVQAGDVLVDSLGNPTGTGLYGSAIGGKGNGAQIEINATGSFALLAGGVISATTRTAANAGGVFIASPRVTIDGSIITVASSNLGVAGTVNITGSNIALTDGGQISASARDRGAAGSVNLTASDSAEITNGGFVTATTATVGNAGSILITSPRVTLDNSVIDVSSSGTGNAGTVNITGSRIAFTGGGQIGASAYDRGVAGSVRLTAAESIEISGRDTDSNRSAVFVSTLGKAPAGSVDMNAPRIDIRDDGLVSGYAYGSTLGGTGTATAGHVRVRATDLVLENGGKISVEGYDAGGQGSVSVEAANSVRIRGRGEGPDPSPGSDTVSTGILGHGTDIRISAAEISVSESGAIRSESWWQDVPGRIDITTQRLTLESGGHISGNALGHSLTSGIGAPIVIRANEFVRVEGSRNGRDSTIASGTRSSGAAGSISIAAPWLCVADDGVINVSTGRFGTAGAGGINIDVDRLELVNGGRLASIEWGHAAVGGHIAVSARESILLDGGQILAWGGNEAAAGKIILKAPSVRLRGGLITTSNEEYALSGGIEINTGQLVLSDSSRIQSSSTSTAGAGTVDVAVTADLSLSTGAQISSSTESSGHAGSVKVNAGSVTIDGQGSNLFTGITSDAIAGSTGNAGSVEAIAKGSLSLANGGAISSSTYGAGKAGSVKVNADRISIDGKAMAAEVPAEGSQGSSKNMPSGISASALPGSSGQTGSVVVTASDSITLSNGGDIAITNDATVTSPGKLTPTSLTVTAPNISLQDAQITAASTGNVAASNIEVNFADRLSLDSSSITTSANAGNGGSIRIQGGKLMVLDNSQITTSVLGESGNGGDIRVAARVLVMNTGFIQANTAAQAASGGNVFIDVGALIPGGNTLTLGSRSAHAFSPGIFGYNVIEAAAPTGLSGNIQVTSPALDLAGALGGLSTAMIDFGALGKDPCRVGARSSLTTLGRGGLPATAGDAIRPEPRLSGATPAMSDAPVLPVQASLLAPASTGKGCE
ncbi:MAG: hypothetical protein A3G81_29830, partial [Betaproteobacteria bacterium RIFCSPLOWO2_12_FULL_65_14]